MFKLAFVEVPPSKSGKVYVAYRQMLAPSNDQSVIINGQVRLPTHTCLMVVHTAVAGQLFNTTLTIE